MVRAMWCLRCWHDEAPRETATHLTRVPTYLDGVGRRLAGEQLTGGSHSSHRPLRHPVLRGPSDAAAMEMTASVCMGLA
jgi:hypothetical protein